MLKKLIKKITHNFGLKLLAAVFAVILWIVVVNIDDPMVPRSYTTSITPINEDYITAQNKYYEPLDSNNTVTFTVSAKRSVHDELSNSDFSAVADMEKIEYNQDDGSYRVPVTITPTRYSSSVEVSARQFYYDVALEDLGTCQKVISASTKGTVADGCALGEIEIVGSNLLKISGPYSVVSQVDTAVATINVDGMSTDVTDSVVPVLYDSDGNVINTAKLTLSINTVAVKAQILNTKDIPLEFSTKGTVADGYMITDVSYDPDTVRIKGEAAVLNEISKVTIPSEVLDVTDATENVETTVDITSYLPDGAALVLSSDAKVKVTVTVEAIASKSFQVPVSNLTVENLKEGYVVEFTEDTFGVEVYGPKDVIDKLHAKSIYGVADANGLGNGSHKLAISLVSEDEDEYWTEDTPLVSVDITGTAVSTENSNSASGTHESTKTDDSEKQESDTSASGETTGSEEKDTESTDSGTTTGSGNVSDGGNTAE